MNPEDMFPNVEMPPGLREDLESKPDLVARVYASFEMTQFTATRLLHSYERYAEAHPPIPDLIGAMIAAPGPVRSAVEVICARTVANALAQYIGTNERMKQELPPIDPGLLERFRIAPQPGMY